jgi:enamine deaminase RidA (YjgF/YER057c/UK114 family)
MKVGACPLDEVGATVAVGDLTGQAVQVMANLAFALHAAGAGLTDVLKTTVYVASQEREVLLAAWDVVSKHFGDHDVPSTLLGVAVLGYPDQLVEVEAVAAIRWSPGSGSGSSVAAARGPTLARSRRSREGPQARLPSISSVSAAARWSL